MKRVGIVGSGIMGVGIAECAAAGGHEVVLRSRRPETAAGMVAGLARSLGRRVERGKLTDQARTETLSRITATADLDAVAGCDHVIESVVEDMATKSELFGELDRLCQPEAILASNTSTLSVTGLAAATTRPDRVCGIHFFNPAPVMTVVEIVRPITASHETIAECRAFVEACGKQPVEVRDQAGFIVNALLFPYLNNAVRLLEAEVASKEDIDAAMKGGCGFPMGPLGVLDLVGLDTSLAILETLHHEHGDANYAPAPLLRRLVAAGRLGRKAGWGFYEYGR